MKNTSPQGFDVILQCTFKEISRKIPNPSFDTLCTLKENVWQFQCTFMEVSMHFQGSFKEV